MFSLELLFWPIFFFAFTITTDGMFFSTTSVKLGRESAEKILVGVKIKDSNTIAKGLKSFFIIYILLFLYLLIPFYYHLNHCIQFY